MNKRIKALDSLVGPFSSQTPGCALAVMKDDEIVHSAGYGMADIEAGIRATDRTVFRLASNAKQFTAFCVFLLESRGKLKLTDDIRKYIPEIPRYSGVIRVHHLIHHTSGLRDVYELFSMTGLETITAVAQALPMLSRQKELNFPPGREHFYCNSGYILLGILVQRVSGKDLKVFAEQEIFKPLGMSHTLIREKLPKNTPHAAHGYSFDANPLKPRKTPVGGITQSVGDGNIFSTAGDLLFWNRNLDSAKVGGRQIINRMHRRGRLNNGDRIDYAGGLWYHNHHGFQIVLHGGLDLGFESQLLRVPSLNLSIACLMNSDTKYNPTGVALKVVDYFAGRSSHGKTLRLTSHRPITPKSIHLKNQGKYVGMYGRALSSPVYQVSTEKGKLWADSGFDKFELAPRKPDDFQGMSGSFSCRFLFKFDGQGRPRHLGIRWEDKPVRTYFPIPPREVRDRREMGALSGNYHSEELAKRFRLSLTQVGPMLWFKFFPLGKEKRCLKANVFKWGGKYLLKSRSGLGYSALKFHHLVVERSRDKVKKITIFFPGGRVRRMVFSKVF